MACQQDCCVVIRTENEVAVGGWSLKVNKINILLVQQLYAKLVAITRYCVVYLIYYQLKENKFHGDLVAPPNHHGSHGPGMLHKKTVRSFKTP